MNIRVENFEDATHWVATEDENNGYSRVTVGIAYALNWDNSNEEHYIIDDRGLKSLIFLAHNGDLIKID
jgi:hypothetical protein